MRIIFFCGSLEPGRDGVGDYVRSLAHQCRESGHTTLSIALNDRHLEPWFTHDDPLEIRHSVRTPPSARVDFVHEQVAEFKPDAICWNVVPYGFNRRGFMPGWLTRLVHRLEAYPQHVMLHELWIGAERGASWKDRCQGGLQRLRLLRWLNEFRIRTVDTSNITYRTMLQRAGVRAGILPMIGNVPLPADAAPSTTATPPAPGAPWKGVIFGSIHPQWDPVPTYRWLQQAARHTRRPVEITAIGHAGAGLEHARSAVADFEPEIRWHDEGMQPLDVISKTLLASDFGLALHPWALIGKSGTAAALSEHGLPVLVPRDDWHLDPPAPSPIPSSRVIRLHNLPPEEFEGWIARRGPPASRLPELVNRLLARLEPATSPVGLSA